MTHTPGPWRDYDEDGCITAELTEDGLEEPEAICAILAGPHAQANADLIMAAPELLAALEDTAIAVCDATCPTVWKTDGGRPHGPRCKASRAAIAKARGES